MADGLCNQHLAQLTGVLLGIHLEANTVIIPPASARDAFWDDPRNVTWTSVPQSRIWDMHLIKKLLQQHDITMVLSDLVPRQQLVHHPAKPPGAADEQVCNRI